MYCVKCGVELAGSERKCPLCDTPVYFPGLDAAPERPFPDNPPKVERVNPRGLYFIISFICLIAAVISVVADLTMSPGISWSGYALGGIILAYVVFILPQWFVRKPPSIFVPVDFAVAAIFVWYISFSLDGDWFFPFALPIIGGVALIVSTPAILCYYIRRGYLYIFGGAFIATGLLTVMIEWLVRIQFNPPIPPFWSAYSAISLGLIGLMLIVIAIVKPFRESLARIFAL